MEHLKTILIDPLEIQNLLGLAMCSDPWPESVDQKVIENLLNRISKSLGFEDWIEALHRYQPEKQEQPCPL